MSDKETVATLQTLNCPNCGVKGFSDAGTEHGDLAECGNVNCSVFKFFHETHEDRNYD